MLRKENSNSNSLCVMSASTYYSTKFCYKFKTIFESLFWGKMTDLCLLVIMPVATVLLFSRIVNSCPLVITIFLNNVIRIFPCSPGMIISFSTAKKILNFQFVKIHQNIKFELHKSIRQGIFHVRLNNCWTHLDVSGLWRPPSFLLSKYIEASKWLEMSSLPAAQSNIPRCTLDILMLLNIVPMWSPATA